jgi:hypothetical protein
MAATAFFRDDQGRVLPVNPVYRRRGICRAGRWRRRSRLMYFLQERGQPLGLDYAKGRYGPYADNLNHALETLEGHYARGYGDRSDRVLNLSPISLVPGG